MGKATTVTARRSSCIEGGGAAAAKKKASLPVKQIDYGTSRAVCQSWDEVKKDPKWQEAFGELMIRKAYQLSPLSVSLFFSFVAKGESMFDNSNKEFVNCCRDSSSTLDFIVSSLLVPDMEMLMEEILELGSESGIISKIRPEHMTVVGISILHAVDKTLKALDDEVRDAWEQAIEHISEELSKKLKPSDRRASTK